MAFKKIARTCIVFCLMAALAVAMSGCEDLGAYEDTNAYYSAFGEIVLIGGTEGIEGKSVEEYFYNEDSREDFLEGEERITPDYYTYMAIPLESTVDMDTLALFIQSEDEVPFYINVFVIDEDTWDIFVNNAVNGEQNAESTDPEAGEPATDNTENVYDRLEGMKVGEVTVHLKSEKWSSFLLDTFRVSGEEQRSIKIEEDQYILLQFKNNITSGGQGIVGTQTELALQRVKITMTNLLVRALDVQNATEEQGGE
jgi:hypothetical protein